MQITKFSSLQEAKDAMDGTPGNNFAWVDPVEGSQLLIGKRADGSYVLFAAGLVGNITEWSDSFEGVYPEKAIVTYEDDVYFSLADENTDEPPSENWKSVSFNDPGV